MWKRQELYHHPYVRVTCKARVPSRQYIPPTISFIALRGRDVIGTPVVQLSSGLAPRGPFHASGELHPTSSSLFQVSTSWMLPLHASAAPKSKMNRHAYSNGHTGAYPLGGRGSFSIQPHKFQPRSQPALRRRRQLLIRLALVGSLLFAGVLLFFPSLRAAALPALSLGLFAGHEELQLETVRYYDLSNVQGTARGWEREERILLCAPLRDAAPHLPMFFSHLRNLTYPHHLIDLAFLIGDSKDNTLTLLSDLLAELQVDEQPGMAFGEISVLEKDFGQKVNQDVESRHGFAAQASRRKSMAQARNWLLSAALRPTHSWVYWRDVDVETAPFTILEDLMRHNKDVIVPNVWRPLPDWLGGEQPYDLNSWQESETALALADTLDEDAVIVEGYAEYATWRPHLAYLRDPYGDPDMEMEIDGVGGVSILAKAKVFRSGVHFPAFSFEKHAETEGFGKMAKRMKFSVVGLPHYTIWHLYEPSVDDIRHMEEMENERKAREAEEKAKQERLEKIQSQFDDTQGQWEKDRSDIESIKKKAQEEEEAVAEAKRQATAQQIAEKQAQDEAAYKAQKAQQVAGGKPVVGKQAAAGAAAGAGAAAAADAKVHDESGSKPRVEAKDGKGHIIDADDIPVVGGGRKTPKEDTL
ncbi:Mannan polymerase II complex anp1 subunit [Zalaria obscura]|uniref:Mannan polymerase II complex anp1 subunit n=1 Tax=Zalaria obscura TaxID=2024903 RepID=A0ACC3SL43_9PEZI